MTDQFSARIANWKHSVDCEAVVSLLDAYAKDPMGGSEPLSAYVKSHLPQAMSKMEGAFSVLGFNQEEPIALANCFTTLSTFACKPVINIHDLAVLPHARGQGIGQRMLAFVESQARERGACKITLEVLTGNAAARRAYEQFGFVAYTLDDSTGHAVFLQKYV